MNDLKFAFHQLLKNPGFTAVAVLTLALGIGVNTSMFSVLNTLLFQALPYPHSERLVRIFRTSPHSQTWPHSAANFLDYREQNSVFDHMTAFRGSSYNLAEPGEATERLEGARVTADFFPSLGVQPALGRVFTQEEDQPNNSQVIVLNNSCWMRRFAGDTNIIGRTLRLDGQSVTVIGVMPPGFEHPLLWGNVDLWRPMAFSEEQRQDRGNNGLQAFGRLKPGVPPGRAEAEMKALAARMGKEYPMNALDSLRLEPLQRQVTDDIGRKVSWFTFGLAGFVLLIACANLGNLQLVRTAARAREFAIRAALGAQRGRLLRQSLTESVMVSLLGGALGLLLASWSNGIIGRQLFSDLPGVSLTLDMRVFGFALFASMLTGLVFGAVPAWLASRADVNDALKENLRGTTASRLHHRLRHALIVGEVGFALVLLTGAGLFIGGLQRFLRLDPGWRVDGVVFAQLSLKGTNYARSFQRSAFFDQLDQRVAALPGVGRVSFSESLPVWPFGSSCGHQIEGRPLAQGQPVPEVYHEAVSVRHFETLGIRLREGRAFNSLDTTNSPRVVIINETMARAFWPNESPIGKRFANPGENPNWREIVGVVNDVRFPASLGEPYTRFQSYEPMAQSPSSRATIALRSSISPEVVANSLLRIVAELDRDQSVHQVRAASALIARGLGRISLLGGLLGAFAVLGLVLAAIGIYGVTSYSVVQRTGEIGIRMALGAQRGDVLWLLLRNGLRLSLLGAVFGLGGAWAVSRLLAWVIPTLPSGNPAIFAAVTIGLIAAALLACYIPARRAKKVNPMEALRYE
jgi:putative ABC transport system permease protein